MANPSSVTSAVVPSQAPPFQGGNNGDRDKKVTPWERVSFEVTRAFVRILAKTFSLTGLYQFGRAFATVEWLINYKRRRRFARRLPDVLGRAATAAEIRRATRGYFVRTRCDKLFYLVLDHLPRKAILDRFHISNRHLLDDAIARGQGAYIALSHHGAQHVAGMLLVACGYKVAGVRDAQEGAMRRYIQDKYQRKNREQVRYFFADTYPRNIYRCFKDNFILGSAIDVNRIRAGHLKTLEVTLFGRKRPFLVGPMQIALRCGAPIVYGFLVSRKNFHYTFELRGPLVEPNQEGTSDEGPQVLRDAMDAYAANIARFARQYPCHVSRI